MKFDCKEDIIQLTQEWKGERFENGRPKVSDDLLRRVRKITLEEAWHALWLRGYKFQYEGGFKMSHPGVQLVGRAVTAVMVPKRPDLHDYLMKYGHTHEGRVGDFNQWVVDSLVENDVVVVDMFDKIFQGTYVGGNLSTAIKSRTKNGGAVIWGGIRDLEQIVKIDGYQVYYRGIDPTPIEDSTMVGMNVPCRIGNAICMPGDVVLGTISGVIFIPSHLVEPVVVRAEKSHLRDIFGFKRLADKTYTTAQIDTDIWSLDIMNDFIDWMKDAPEAAEYKHLDWSDEIESARKKEY
jgi:regulator of RNase E activity RraA